MAVDVKGYDLIISDVILVALECVEDLEEGEVVHLHLVDLAAHIGQHVILGGETHFVLLILLEVGIDNAGLLGRLLLLELVFHETARSLVQRRGADPGEAAAHLKSIAVVHVLQLFEKSLVGNEDLVS